MCSFLRIMEYTYNILFFHHNILKQNTNGIKYAKQYVGKSTNYD